MKRHNSGEFDDEKSEQTCKICNNKYKSKRDLNRHARRMHRTDMWTSYTCQYCGKFFTRKSDGQVHERKVHRLQVEEDKHFKCHFCVRGFDTEYFRQLHEQNHKMGELNCRNCKKQFYYRAQCKSHEVVCGIGNLFDDDSKELYICHYCNKTFTRKGSLLPHFSNHLSIFMFSCELCGNSFKRKETLKRHLVTLHSEQRGSLIQCEVCAKILSSMAALKRHHKQTHDKGKKLQENTTCHYSDVINQNSFKDDYHEYVLDDKTKDNVKMEQFEEERNEEIFVVEEQDVAQTIEVYSVSLFP